VTRSSTRYVGQLLPLSFLAPDIVSAVLTSTIPAELTAEILIKRVVCPWIGPNRGTLLGSRQHHNTVNWNRFLDPQRYPADNLPNISPAPVSGSGKAIIAGERPRNVSGPAATPKVAKFVSVG
jgi:hypothetical protein